MNASWNKLNQKEDFKDLKKLKPEFVTLEETIKTFGEGSFEHLMAIEAIKEVDSIFYSYEPQSSIHYIAIPLEDLDNMSGKAILPIGIDAANANDLRLLKYFDRKISVSYYPNIFDINSPNNVLIYREAI